MIICIMDRQRSTMTQIMAMKIEGQDDHDIFMYRVYFNTTQCPLTQTGRELWSNNRRVKSQRMLPKCFNNYTHHLPQILHNSGRSVFQKGHYWDCLDQPELKYGMVSYAINGSQSGLFSGMCLPRACSDQAITEYTNDVLNSVNSSLTVYHIDSTAEEYSYPLFWVTYLTIALLTVFVLMTLCASISKWLRKDKASSDNLLISAFDLGKNMKHFEVREGESLNIMDGVRALAMMWVVIGHSYSFYTMPMPINLPTIQHTIHKPFMLILEAGFLAVDTFFMLGGFFLSFVILREKNFTGLKYLLAVPQRALRIWPAYIMLMMVGYSIVMHLGSGPLWPSIQSFVTPCQEMWKDIFFVSNLAGDGQHICMGWGWYLQVDFQLFLMGLLLLFLYKKYPKVSIATTCLLTIASLAYNLVYTYKYQIHIANDMEGPNENNGKYFHDIYVQAWGRCSPYFIGLLFGIAFMNYRRTLKADKTGLEAGILGRIKESCQASRLVRWGIEWLGIAIMSFIVFIPYSVQKGGQWPQIVHTLHKTFDKPLFVIGIILTILPSSLGQTNSFFNLILTNKIFTFIARVSFSTYLVHFLVVGQVIATKTTDIYFTLTTVFPVYLGILALSLFFGFLLTVVVELPFANIQKHLMTKLLKPASKVKKDGVEGASQSLITRNDSLVENQTTQKVQDLKQGRVDRSQV